MRKYLIGIIGVIVASLIINGCDDTTGPEDSSNQTGSIYLTSTPANATIIVDGTTYTQTPDSVTGLSVGDHTVILSFGTVDTTFTVTVQANIQTTQHITFPLNVTMYQSIRLYDKNASSFSGLVLSTGQDTNSTADNVDLWYDGIDADSLFSGHLRDVSNNQFTDFYLGTSSNIHDGLDSPVYSSSDPLWQYSIHESYSNYVFVSTNNLHYAKLIISAAGGGTGPSDPDKWVEVTYMYNNLPQDVRFN